MKALALTNPGIADVGVLEVKELLGIKAVPKKECVLFETSQVEQLFELCYKSQSLTRVLFVVSEGSFEKLDIPEIYKRGSVKIVGKSITKSNELAKSLGVRVDYKKPDVLLYLHFENDHYWLGIDLAGRDLGKRDYRVFVGSERLTGPSAYALLRIAGYSPEQSLLDPFCRAGSIVVEAALFSKRLSPHYYSKDKLWFTYAKTFEDKSFEKLFAEWDNKVREVPGKIFAFDTNFKGVQATRKNAQIAGVLKELKLSRTETEWLDVKLGKESLDLIATQPPEVSARFSKAKTELLYEQLFDNAKIMLKQSGRVACVLQKDTALLEKHAAQKNFSVQHKRTVMQGKEEWKIIVFSRK